MVSLLILICHQLHYEKIRTHLYKVNKNGITISIAKDISVFGRFNFQQNGGGFGFGSERGEKIW